VNLKKIAISFAVVFAALSIWKYRNSDFIQSIVQSQDPKKPAIQFDNGTVRQYQRPTEAELKAEPKTPGVMRKCKNGDKISYTNSWCPPGAKELTLTNGTVNVVEGNAANAKSAKPKNDSKELNEKDIPEVSLSQRRIDQAAR
jgi:hypothetical protein